VPRYRPAVFVAPTRRDAPPWPVVLILHGNFDRPEWECEWWTAAAAPHGWLLSPRGIPRTDVPRSYDRWTYAGATPAAREAHAALDVLKARYPGLVREDGALYVGFSLGAILAGRAMVASRLRFTHAALVEGGDAIDFSLMRRLAKRGLGRVAYLCGQHSGCGRRAKAALRRWRRAGVEARLWIMPGAGHGYSDDFDPLGKQVLAWLLAPPTPKPAATPPAVRPAPRPAPRGGPRRATR
jgi:predicted esterase